MEPFSVVIMGPPGTGKSTFAGSICEIVPPQEVLLIVTKPGEEMSWLYRKYGLQPEFYFDAGWRPSLGKFQATAFNALMRRLEELLSDDKYGAIIIDPGTDAVNLIEHAILAPHQVGSPGELADTQGFYRQLGDKAQELVMSAALLATGVAKRPKFVVMTWHVQPAKEGLYVKTAGGRVKQESADEKAQGVEYEGNVLPMIEGRYRRKLAGDVSVVIFTDVESKSVLEKGKVIQRTDYYVQPFPNQDMYAKVRMAPCLNGLRLPNNMKALIEAIKGES